MGLSPRIHAVGGCPVGCPVHVPWHLSTVCTQAHFEQEMSFKIYILLSKFPSLGCLAVATGNGLRYLCIPHYRELKFQTPGLLQLYTF